MERKFVNGLIDRRLFRLAEALCQRRVDEHAPGSYGQARWTAELIRVLTAKAVHAGAGERAAVWESVNEVAREFEQFFPDHPQGVLVQLQLALSLRVRGQQLQQEIELEMRPPSATKTAQRILQDAARELEAVERSIQSLVPAAPATSEEDALSKEELLSLRTHVRAQQGRCSIDRALLYSTNQSLDRMDALRRAEQQLADVVSTTNRQQALWWNTQAELLRCLRLQNKITEAQRMLQALLADKSYVEQVSMKAVDRLVEEQLQLALVTADRVQVERAISASVELPERRPAHDLLLVNAWLWLASQLGEDASKASELRQKALNWAERIEVRHGAYWARRANLVLTKSLGNRTTSTGDARILLRVAREAERRKQWDDAIDAYDEAAAAFGKLNATKQQIDAAFRAALIEQQAGRHAKAFERLHRLGQEVSSGERAPQFSLLAIWNLAQIVGDDPQQLNRYRDALREHVARWPTDETTDQARLWLARYWIGKDRHRQAIALLLDVSPESRHFSAAVDLASRVIDPAVRPRDGEEQNDRQRFLNQLADKMEARVTEKGEEIPDDWTPATRQLAVMLARLSLLYQGGDPEQWIEWLQAVGDSIDEADSPLRSRAAAWSVVSLAWEADRRDELQFRLSHIQNNSAWIDLRRGLSELWTRTKDNSKRRRLLAETELMVWRAIGKAFADLDEGQQVQWSLARAKALSALGNEQEALELLARLAEERSQNASVQMAYADLLTESTNESNWRRALGRWRWIASRSRRNTPRWFRAKYQIASLLLKLGKKQEARQLLEYIQAVPPGWAESQLADEFDALLRRCKPPSP